MFKRLLNALVGDPTEKALKKLQPIVAEINALEPTVEKLTDAQLRAKTDEFRERMEAGETLDDLLPEAFAAVREAARRNVGMRPYDVQLIGGMVLHQGKIAEQKTGEGKTLVASLALYLNSLEGRGAHLITPNDYLSKVGTQLMGPIYHALGVSVAVIQSQGGDGVFQPAFLFDPDYQSDDDRYQHLRPVPRAEAYQADITYGTNNEFGFDYLRDNMARSRRNRVQRELRYAIVDEVDNILIDEARTPLIISGPAEEPSELYGKLASIVRSFKGMDQRIYDDLRKRADQGDEDAEDEINRYQFVVDEKNRVTTVLESGIERAERALGVENLYDPANFQMTHFLDNAVRAHGIYQKDRDYVVSETGEVIIVDEFTGRMMFGRRFSEGLHQAIEAKEGVTVQRENMTLATITFQNFFRMYDKLAGMTGTAVTEEEEFAKIYGLSVVAIPTHRPVVREDTADQIYKNEMSKYRAVIAEIEEMHQLGRPVLVGTASIERSELLSNMLKRAGIPHEVLNAKYHEREAEIIAQAGRPKAVTIATNMAGRGVDIILGGNPEGIARRELRKRYPDLTEVPPEEWEAELTKARATAKKDGERIRELGGLHIIGTERHDARRIDNQLRGRAGRQGDPGSTRFYLSLEDDLMRRFAGANLIGIMDRLGLEDDIPIEHGMVSKAVENAQVKVEGHNFDVRKRVLEYDDVVNKQREVIYGQRTEVLDTENLRPDIERMLEAAIQKNVEGLLQPDEYGRAPDYHIVLSAVRHIIPISEDYDTSRWAQMDPDEIVEELIEEMRRLYDEREEAIGSEQLRDIERQLMLDIVDRHWIRHLTELDHLRQGIGLRAIAQQDPLAAYKTEASALWGELIGNIEETMVNNIFSVSSQIVQQKFEQREMQLNRSDAGAAASAPQPIKSKSRPGRNDPCHCGSGKKYKNCHWAEDENKARARKQPAKQPAR
ncbi:MAG TPA: preprotein translocase subunit SecA [Ardenticatenaceae bacterium]